MASQSKFAYNLDKPNILHLSCHWLSPCFGKCDRNLGCGFWIMACQDFRWILIHLTTPTIAFDKPRGFILDMLNLWMQLCKVYVSNLSSMWEEHKSISCCFLRGKVMPALSATYCWMQSLGKTTGDFLFESASLNLFSEPLFLIHSFP
jgi:hypothetical protein